MQGLQVHIGPTSGRLVLDIVIQVLVTLGLKRKMAYLGLQFRGRISPEWLF
jgi:hypothetical protein